MLGKTFHYLNIMLLDFEIVVATGPSEGRSLDCDDSPPMACNPANHKPEHC